MTTGLQRSVDRGRAEDLLTRGIAAVKAGQMEEARSFLMQATRENGLDPRPWVWLSATTTDPAERRHYLEEALAIDPLNGAARQGLVTLVAQSKGEALLAHGTTAQQAQPAQPAPAKARRFNCRQCGGLMKYDPQTGSSRCERCGTLQEIEQENVASDRHEQGLDFVLPTARAHRWAAAEHAMQCSGCGAATVLPPSHLTAACPFCGSDHLISSPHTTELLEPQGILPMQVEEKQTHQIVRQWMATGLFTPGDLKRQSHGLTLRPAYYPAWTFDATYNARWTAVVTSADGKRKERKEGEGFLFFDDVLVPGSKQLTVADLESVTPFDFKQLLAFKEEFLVGWPALLYDQSLADASIVARGEMNRRARELMEERVLVGQDKDQFQLIPKGLSDQSYRQLLLPLWVGHYRYKGKIYPIFINGQTGKAGGEKPKDSAMVAVMVAAGGGGLLLIVFLIWLVSQLA